MLREICDVLKGSFIWIFLKIRDGINYNKVVLVLTGDNTEVDKYAIDYLDKAIERKHAKESLIYITNADMANDIQTVIKSKYRYSIRIVKETSLDCIYKRYCLNKFFKNIFWTYTDHTKNNLLGRFIRETDIDAKDAVCLAIYNLRNIPNG